MYIVHTKVRPNQIWQGRDDAHSLIIIARSMVLPYLIGSYFILYYTIDAKYSVRGTIQCTMYNVYCIVPRTLYLVSIVFEYYILPCKIQNIDNN